MKIGAMNHPQHDVIDEIRWMAGLGLDFLDLTLEPPAAASWLVDPSRIRAALRDHGLGVVGHTAYYLPIGSPFEEIRRATVLELSRCLEVFGQVGAKWMNIHPDRYAPMHDRAFFVARDIETLRELNEVGRRCGVGLMVENLPVDFNTVTQLADLLDPLEWLGLHLDIGHANLHVSQNSADSLIEKFAERIQHVHLHDNKGGAIDMHLPLGAGTIDVAGRVKKLKTAGYDGTITLEVFTPDHTYLKYSRDVLRRLWDEIVMIRRLVS